MNFELSESQTRWRARTVEFMQEHVYPNVATYNEQLSRFQNNQSRPIPVLEELRNRARRAGLWNLFMSKQQREHGGVNGFRFEGPSLTNLEYALCAEQMGRVSFASKVFNCAAPDTGNMEILFRYGTPEQKETWLKPLSEARIRSAFLMSEPDVASSDATNIRTSIVSDVDDYVISGRKWWSTGIGDPACRLAIVMGKTKPDAPRHAQQSMVLVPTDAPGFRVVRMLSVFGFDDAPHGHAEVILDSVRVPRSNILLGEGRGFEIAQSRLGPGRIHHCMRTIGAAELALENMARRLSARTSFGKRLSDMSLWHERVAHARIDIEATRLMCLNAADKIDRVGAKAARLEIAMVKVSAPRAALRIIDDAIQAFGAAGMDEEAGLARLYSTARTLRVADGPDEVHNRTIAQMEFRKYDSDEAP